ncbi:MAG: sulfur-carrier protein [Actinomycetota bacterium]|nr:sulfur-carrier protein [Actinomycetota bacterium]
MAAEVRVRLFAAAAHAAGSDEVQAAPGELREVLAEVQAQAVDRARFDRVLAQCSVLCDGLLTAGAGEADSSTAPIPAGATVDVLPPFAGG